MDEHNASLIPEYASTSQKVKALDKLGVAKWHKFLRIKWVGEDNEPATFFFQIVQAKRQRGYLTEMLLDDGTLLVIEHDKLIEIHTFYLSLFTTIGHSPSIETAKNTLYKRTSFNLTKN